MGGGTTSYCTKLNLNCCSNATPIPIGMLSEQNLANKNETAEDTASTFDFRPINEADLIEVKDHLL
jgi:hypothetical protein